MAWNRFIYALWAPVYDFLFGISGLAAARRRAFEQFELQPGEICLVGIGTGSELQLLPAGSTVRGVDLSEKMLARAKGRLPVDGCEVTLEQANAEALPFADESFDAVVLSLIVAVASDGAACLREAVRVTRSGGRLYVFDKFLKPGRQASKFRRLLNPLTRLFGTEINRSFEGLRAGLPVEVLKDEPVFLGGTFRAIVLVKRPS